MNDIKIDIINNDKLFDYIYSIYQTIDLLPNKEHIINTIEYTDLLLRKDEFISELINTIIDWVYSTQKQKQLIDDRLKENSTSSNAYTFLYQLAKRKFRRGQVQGQFGELLLFNFLEKFFNAAPLVRKMPITTSSNMERFGADAIHVGKKEDKMVLYLGEAKCYKSDCNFSTALKASIDSIFKTFTSISNEMSLYVYDDFIGDDLQSIAKDFLDNKLTNIRFELICIILYNENKKLKSDTEADIKTEIIEIVKERCKNFDKSFYNDKETKILNRLHYILFPIWDLDCILESYVESM